MSEWRVAPPPGPNAGVDVPLSQSAAEPLYQRREQIIRTPKVAYRGQLSVATSVLYTAPSLTNSPSSATAGGIATSQIRRITVCNTDTVTRTYTFTIVETGGSVADNRAIAKDVSIAPKTTHIYRYEADEEVLMDGETINGLASSGSRITVRISVVETTH
jgi:hypothetical protein